MLLTLRDSRPSIFRSPFLNKANSLLPILPRLKSIKKMVNFTALSRFFR